MKKKLTVSILVSLVAFNIQSSSGNDKCNFLWGTASSAYQVEGGWNLDGKGPSNWDYFTHNNVTKHVTGKSENGDIATNQISRDVYIKDIQLMKKMGVNAYRFSIAWSRVMPDGVSVNPKGIEYYQKLIKDLKDAGIKPIITLYHWDMPLTLYKQGGWSNPASPQWFSNYSNLIFKNFGKDAPYFITFNEPEGYIFTLSPLVDNLVSATPEGYEKVLSVKSRAIQATSMHNVLLANALAVSNYHKMKNPGKIGMALNLSPCIDPDNNVSQAAEMCNEVHNKWILDAVYKGEYPKEVKELYEAENPNFRPTDAEMIKISAAKPDFIGVNYYGPTLVKDDINKPFGIGDRPNPDKEPSYNGPVSPKEFINLLISLKNNYGNPELIITENGAGFGPSDEKLKDGIVQDPLRTKYLSAHIDAITEAKKEGANVKGYLFWSFLDNFEWLWGYQNRFGIVSVDFTSKDLKRTPKSSYFEYKEKIEKFKKENKCK